MIINTFYSSTMPLWPGNAARKQLLPGPPSSPSIIRRLDDKHCLIFTRQTRVMKLYTLPCRRSEGRSGERKGDSHLAISFSLPVPQRCCFLRSTNFTFCALLAERIRYRHQF